MELQECKTAVGEKISSLDSKHSHTKSDVERLTDRIIKQEDKAEGRHQHLLGVIEKFEKALLDHMEDEEEWLHEKITPLHAKLDKLHDRWFALMKWGLLTLSSGLLGLALYIWQTHGHP